MDSQKRKEEKNNKGKIKKNSCSIQMFQILKKFHVISNDKLDVNIKTIFKNIL